jgi:multidrug efflux pump subunit AcrA (membrane-fusion protein)
LNNKSLRRVQEKFNQMKKTLVITGIVVVASLILLFVFNRITSKKNVDELFTEVQRGEFEIALNATGELIPERSMDILGPNFAQSRNIRSRDIKIQDLIPEGTEVSKGDYIATLDRTELDNSLKDQKERLVTFEANLEMKLLDSAVVLNALRDGIRNQKFIVEEAAITLRNSKYEPPTTLRQAEIDYDKAQRVLEQLERSYTRRLAQSETDIYNQRYFIGRVTRWVNELEEVLAGFTITAPSSGMVIYKRERRGNKRKIGSTISPFDRVVATLPDLSSMISKTFVNEIDVSKVKVGQPVNITIDAFPDKAYTGSVLSVAQIGEELPNTNDKVFEVQIKIDYTDPLLRPSMTTSNKIILKTVDDAVFVPIECVQAGVDRIPFVYTKSGIKQIVVVGGSNDKYIRIVEGLEPGTLIYITNPENPEKFKLAGDELIPVIEEMEREKLSDYDRITKKAEIIN